MLDRTDVKGAASFLQRGVASARMRKGWQSAGVRGRGGTRACPCSPIFLTHRAVLPVNIRNLMCPQTHNHVPTVYNFPVKFLYKTHLRKFIVFLLNNRQVYCV